MSGFCGCFNRDGEPVQIEEIRPVMDALVHHSRDGSGLWMEGTCALGHQMTHVTPQSHHETLPYEDKTTGLVITGDVRLDNREELLRVLTVPHEQWTQLPDTSLVLLAYSVWGSNCVDHILGDFAFAIWDRFADKVFCARDFIGAKPFYYFAGRDRFCFASDITALLAFSSTSDKLNLRYARTYTEFPRFTHLEFTFYEDVIKLPPGHTLTVLASAHDLRPFWSPQECSRPSYKRDDEYFDHLRWLLEESVATRMRSAFPVGTHISGGLDSSAVAVLAARRNRQNGQNTLGFSWAPPPRPEDYPLLDERAYVEAVCDAESIVPVYTPLGPEDLMSVWVWDITRHPEHTLRFEIATSRIIREMECRVVLSGWGGDETVAFNGRGYFADSLRRGRWRALTRELSMRTRLHEDSFWGNLKSRAILPLLPDGVITRLRPDLMDQQSLILPAELLQPDFAAEISKVEPYCIDDLRERPGVRENQIRLLLNGHLTERMESFADLGGHRGIEYRYPLLDKRIVEFALAVPDHLYHSQGWKRFLFREATAGLLPDPVRWRKYKGEPALLESAQRILPDAQRLLLSHIEEQRDQIQAAGYIEADAFLTAMNGIQNDTSDARIAFPLLWLAQLR